MLSRADNEAITRVGPGTPMGNLMRQYWLPALLSSELPSVDSDAVRVLLLGEKLIASRDSHGEVGFDSTAYPTRERCGVVWAYLGPRSEPPPLPSLEGNMLPDGEWSAIAVQRECNYLQALEGDIDTSHFSFLHAGSLQADAQPRGTFSYYMLSDRAPRYSLLDTDYGTMYGAFRDTDDGRRYWRIAQFLFPFYTMPPQGVLGHKITVRAWVPMDDEHTMFFMMGPRLRRIASAPAGTPSPLGRFAPSTPSDWYGRFRLSANGANDYQIDRAKQRRNTEPEDFTGITGIHLQDQAITESMGGIYDRTKEHLGSSDTMIIRTRRRLLAAARALEETGEGPPALDTPEAYGARAGGVFLPRDADWLSATEELRRGFVQHPELDLSVTGPLV